MRERGERGEGFVFRLYCVLCIVLSYLNCGNNTAPRQLLHMQHCKQVQVFDRNLNISNTPHLYDVTACYDAIRSPSHTVLV